MDAAAEEERRRDAEGREERGDNCATVCGDLLVRRCDLLVATVTKGSAGWVERQPDREAPLDAEYSCARDRGRSGTEMSTPVPLFRAGGGEGVGTAAAPEADEDVRVDERAAATLEAAAAAVGGTAIGATEEEEEEETERRERLPWCRPLVPWLVPRRWLALWPRRRRPFRIQIPPTDHAAATTPAVGVGTGAAAGSAPPGHQLPTRPRRAYRAAPARAAHRPGPAPRSAWHSSAGSTRLLGDHRAARGPLLRAFCRTAALLPCLRCSPSILCHCPTMSARSLLTSASVAGRLPCAGDPDVPPAQRPSWPSNHGLPSLALLLFFFRRPYRRSAIRCRRRLQRGCRSLVHSHVLVRLRRRGCPHALSSSSPEQGHRRGHLGA